MYYMPNGATVDACRLSVPFAAAFYVPIRSLIIRWTSPPSARPFVSRITAPTIAPIA
jgi:hypothetical protein